jgi:hypothetical protein
MSFGGVAVLMAILSGPGASAPESIPTDSSISIVSSASTAAAGLTQQVNRDDAVKSFFGTIVKDGDKFVLNDEKRKIWYELDDQQTVRKFSGKKVKLTGTLDVTKNLIRVQSIEEAST